MNRQQTQPQIKISQAQAISKTAPKYHLIELVSVLKELFNQTEEYFENSQKYCENFQDFKNTQFFFNFLEFENENFLKAQILESSPNPKSRIELLSNYFPVSQCILSGVLLGKLCSSLIIRA